MNSKIISLYSAMLLLLTACGLKAQSNYTVIMPVEDNINSTMAYLLDWDSSRMIDSVIVVNNKAIFHGYTEKPFIARIAVNGERGLVLFIEPGTVTISDDLTPTGTPLNEKMIEVLNSMSALQREFRTLDQNDSIQHARARQIIRELDLIPARTYADNKGSAFGLYWFLQTAYDLDLKAIDSAIAADPSLGESKQVQSIRTNLIAQHDTRYGSRYKDFAVSYKGKEQKLSDFVKPGRYTIVDFWASWCKPCIAQGKILKDLWEKYHDKGLEIVGVAVWDMPDDTRSAIKRHGYKWPCILDAQTVPTDLYGITGIPCIILINPEGIIISRDKQNRELIEDVDNAMAAYAASQAKLAAEKSAKADSTASEVSQPNLHAATGKSDAQ